jgi:hypothetical protein
MPARFISSPNGTLQTYPFSRLVYMPGAQTASGFASGLDGLSEAHLVIGRE